MASPKMTNKQAAAAATATAAAPSQPPPVSLSGTTGGNGAVVETEPMPISEAEMAAVLSAAVGAAPAFEPPELKVTSGIQAWVSNKLVNALWCINQNRNVWAGFAGVGWKKFADNSDSAAMAFTILASNAKITQGVTNYREESDGKVYEMYVW